MRTPTPHRNLYAWHTAALRGEPVKYHQEPNCGWFVIRMVPRGAPIPCSIYPVQDIDPETGELMDDERIEAEILGEIQPDATEAWLRFAKRPICKLYYQELLGRMI